MAKRRKLEAPSDADLSRIEAEFRSETSVRPASAPIAQVAGEAASEGSVLGVKTREKLAEADAFREAREKGLVLREIPIDRIRDDELVRDRAVLDRSELDELRASILKNGLRMPIEVYELTENNEEFDFGLISGYRRLLAHREIFEFTENAKFATIKAIVRPRKDSADSIAAMVEENEVRAGLSHFERGRIAALSAQNGVFTNVEDAVDQLFPFASKAKRSKVRSFALVFEEIGDVMQFPETLTERQGLAIAVALRAGADNALRDALANGSAATPDEEWALILPVLDAFETVARDAKRGGRPAKNSTAQKATVIRTESGVTIAWAPDDKGGYSLRLTGKIDRDLMDELLGALRDRLG